MRSISVLLFLIVGVRGGDMVAGDCARCFVDLSHVEAKFVECGFQLTACANNYTRLALEMSHCKSEIAICNEKTQMAMKRIAEVLTERDELEERLKEVKNLLDSESWKTWVLWVQMAAILLALFYRFVHVLWAAVKTTARMSLKAIQNIYGWLRDKFKEPVVSEYYELPGLNDHGGAQGSNCYQREAYVQGSEYIPINKYPDCQVKVYGLSRGGIYNYLGCGFWAGTKKMAKDLNDSYLFTAAHVLTGYDTIRMANANDAKKFVDVMQDEFITVEGIDASVLPISSLGGKITTLGIKKGKTRSRTIDGEANMVSVHARDMQTNGRLQKDRECMGGVVYVGSTTRGFSGAPYVSHNTVYGMHLGSVACGLGYEMKFLEAMVDMYLKNYTREDSIDDVLNEIMDEFEKTGHKKKFKRSPFNADEIYFEHTGVYHMIDKRDLKWQAFEEFNTDVRSMHKEFMDVPDLPKNVQAAPMTAPTAMINAEELGKKMDVDTAGSDDKFQSLLTALNSLASSKETSPGLEQILVPRCAALKGTFKSLKVAKKKHEEALEACLTLILELRSGHEPLTNIESGKSSAPNVPSDN